MHKIQVNEESSMWKNFEKAVEQFSFPYRYAYQQFLQQLYADAKITEWFEEDEFVFAVFEFISAEDLFEFKMKFS